MAEKACDLVERLQALPDPRRQCKNLKHQLVDLLVLGFCGTLADCDDFVEVAEWASQNEAFFRTFLELPNGIPSHDTFTRVFAAIRPDALRGILLPWLLQRCGTPGKLVHLDGKAMRRTRSDARELGALHVVSAWAGTTGITLGQVAADAKSNEITALPELIALLDLRQKVVTIDAMGCQKEIARQVADRKGDYVLSLKGNQPTFHEEAQAAFAQAASQPAPRGREHTTEEKGHGRHERRTVRALPAGECVSESRRQEWAGLMSLVMVTRVVTCLSSGAVSTEASYFISSLRPSARRIGQAIRSHWGIEAMHWVLDVVFREDARRLYDRTAAENVALMNRMAVSLLRGDASKGSFKVKRKRAGWNMQFLAQLLGFHGD